MRPERDRLGDILSSIHIIEATVSDMDKDGFLAAFREEARFADALCFRLVVIGEAVASLLEASRRDPTAFGIVAAHPEIDWPGYVGMRNIVAHQYFRRDPTAIWVAVTEELSDLKRVAERRLAAG